MSFSTTIVIATGRYDSRWEITAQFDGTRFSCTGHTPTSSGQCQDALRELLTARRDTTVLQVTEERLRTMLALWDRYHLNDMHADCVHQRDWDVGAMLTLTPLTWGPHYHTTMRQAGGGHLSAEDYAAFMAMSPRVRALTTEPERPQHRALWPDDIDALLAQHWVRMEEATTRRAGNTFPTEHPDGLLTKACAVCGHQYGSAWLTEVIPEDVVSQLHEVFA